MWSRNQKKHERSQRRRTCNAPMPCSAGCLMLVIAALRSNSACVARSFWGCVSGVYILSCIWPVRRNAVSATSAPQTGVKLRSANRAYRGLARRPSLNDPALGEICTSSTCRCWIMTCEDVEYDLSDHIDLFPSWQCHNISEHHLPGNAIAAQMHLPVGAQTSTLLQQIHWEDIPWCANIKQRGGDEIHCGVA